MIREPGNIYLHFLDRELRESVGIALPYETILAALVCATLMTDKRIYFPLSHLYECALDYPKLPTVLMEMCNAGLIVPVSSHETSKSFFESRKLLYAHDRSRYPMYFADNTRLLEVETANLPGSTTAELREGFLTTLRMPRGLSAIEKREYRDAINEGLFISEEYERAVTSKVFAEPLEIKAGSNQFKRLFRSARLSVSHAYVNRYIAVGDATIVAGIPGLGEFDRYASQDGMTSFPLYQALLLYVGLDCTKEQSVSLVIDVCCHAERERVIRLLRECAIGVTGLMGVDRFVELTSSEMRRSLFSLLGEFCHARIENAAGFVGALSELHDFMEVKDMLDFIDTSTEPSSSYVLIAATQVEMSVLKQVAEQRSGTMMKFELIGGRAVWTIPGFKHQVYAVQSEMGSIGHGSAIDTVAFSFEYLHPKAMIMGGIAFGARGGHRHLGDTLIAKKVWSYEPQKEKAEGSIPRGTICHCDVELLSVFNALALGRKPKCHFGLLASGEKLVDSSDFLGKLLAQQPELIGGDMESAGFVAECESRHIPWAVVKGISDWAADKDDSKQDDAARASFSLALDVLGELDRS